MGLHRLSLRLRLGRPLSLALLLGGAFATAQQTAPAPVAAPASPLNSVVLVRAAQGDITLPGEHRFAQGSGVVIAPGLVATNAHVVQGQRTYTVLHEGRSWPAVLRAVDGGRDLCLLSVPGLPLPPAPAAPAPPEVGQAVQAVGFPAGRSTLTRGVLKAVWRFPGGVLLQSDARTTPGSSGGGLFDDAGRLLGLTTFVFEQSPAINFAVSAGALAALLERPSGEDAARAADPFPELVQTIADHPENQPAWEVFTAEWTARNPQDPDAWYARGSALHLKLKKAAAAPGVRELDEALWTETVAAFRKAAELRPAMAQAWNNLGAALELNNRFPESEAALRTALKLAPDYALAWSNLGHTLFNARRPRDAAAALRTALAYRPLDGDLWWNLGLAEAQAGAPREGLAHLEKATGLLPNHAELWAEVVRLRTRLGDRRGAAEALTRLRDLHPHRADEVAKELAGK